MKIDPFPVRKSARLKDFDYKGDAWFFITIGSYEMREIFGFCDDRGMHLYERGQIVEDEWLKTSEMRPGVTLDFHVVMPNHFHATLFLAGPGKRTIGESFRGDDLRQVVNGFKSAVTSRARKSEPEAVVWKRGFHDRIVRSERELEHIRDYIRSNPWNWAADRHNRRKA